MDHSSNREGGRHDEGHHQHQFSYHQQQPGSAGRGTHLFTSSSSSRDHLSPSHSHPHIREWFSATQPSAEDNTCFRSSYNFMEENEENEDKVSRRIEHQQQSSSSYYNSHSSHHSQNLASIELQTEKEHMFDKVVTPSDVGKLNRLVIPKQQAERYFPLDLSANEKGLLLNFEDRTHKLWRFRYSYWNSSQSYVMTKGWSRFVKEKKLDAGDIVSFQRGVGEAFRDRYFIDWRRRPSNPLLLHHEPSLIIPSLSFPHQYFPFHQGSRSAPWTASATTSLYLQPLAELTSGHYFPQHSHNNFHSHTQSHSHHYNQYQQQQQLQQSVNGNFQYCSPYYKNNGVTSIPYGAAAVGCSSQTVMYLKSSADESPGGNGMNSLVIDSVPVVHPLKAKGKKLRLFGVNMEYGNLPNTFDESENLSSSPIPATASSPPDSPHFQNNDDTSDPNGRSQGIMSLNLSF